MFLNAHTSEKAEMKAQGSSVEAWAIVALS